MKIIKTEIYKFSIPMVPFTIATGTMDQAQNIFIRIHTDQGYFGVGECSAFPMIVGETQATCFELAKDFASLWKNKETSDIAERMDELHSYIAYNATIKSAFDMALYDIAAKEAGLPLYAYLGGHKRPMETDLTIGIDTPSNMAATAIRYVEQGVRIIKIKLGKSGKEDVERVKQIRQSVGDKVELRIDANQGWDYETACYALTEMGKYHIRFCEQPMRRWNDYLLPDLRKISPVKIMADESVFDHHDSLRLIQSKACDYVNIKFAKSGGILEATKIVEVCTKNQIPCMMGGMLESRVALTAFAHFAMAYENIRFYDMDTCMLGHKIDPVQGGVRYNGMLVEVPADPGIGVDVEEGFLKGLEQVIV